MGSEAQGDGDLWKVHVWKEEGGNKEIKENEETVMLKGWGLMGKWSREKGRVERWKEEGEELSDFDPFALRMAKDADYSGFLPVSARQSAKIHLSQIYRYRNPVKCLLVMLNLFSDMNNSKHI